MNITHEFLFDRLASDPLNHLGGYDPDLLGPYFMGYDHARRYRGEPDVTGILSYRAMGEWFSANRYGGPQGLPRFCTLLTNEDQSALDLYFEMRWIRLEQIGEEKESSDVEEPEQPVATTIEEPLSLLDLILHEAMRTRTAMYFGNENWMSGMWSMWSGYIWAERDLGIANSPEAEKFAAFQSWIDERYPFAQGQNWGKVIEFRGMGVNDWARREFYDLFGTFLEGLPPDGQSKACKEWIAACLADVEERRAKGEL